MSWLYPAFVAMMLVVILAELWMGVIPFNDREGKGYIERATHPAQFWFVMAIEIFATVVIVLMRWWFAR